MSLNDTRYVEWEKEICDIAYSKAKEYIDDYNNGVKCVTYNICQSKEVEAYKLMKVWHLLDCNGIFMGIDIKKRKDKLYVMLEFYPSPT